MRTVIGAIALFLLFSLPAFSASVCIPPENLVATVKRNHPTARVVAIFTGKDAEVIRMIYNFTPPRNIIIPAVDQAIAMYKRGELTVYAILSNKGCTVSRLSIHIIKFKRIWPKISLDAVAI